jgi:PKHD-type hydroxylase
MLLTLADVLAVEVIERLRSVTELTPELSSLLMSALLAHPLFVMGVAPVSGTTPILRRWANAAERRPQVADAMPDGPEGIRADVAVILVLSGPTDYEGGELLLDAAWGTETLKPDAGTCVCYPASVSAGMTPITRGVRITVELFVESLVADAARRQILYDIGCAASMLELFAAERKEEAETLRKSHQNLLRLWARR